MGILKGHLKVICFDVRHCWFPWRACGSCLCSSSSKTVLTTHSSCKALSLGANSTSLQENDSYSGSLEDCLEAACHDFLRILKTLSYLCFPFPFWLLQKTILTSWLPPNWGFWLLPKKILLADPLLSCFPQLFLIFELLIYYYGYIRFFLAPLAHGFLKNARNEKFLKSPFLTTGYHSLSYILNKGIVTSQHKRAGFLLSYRYCLYRLQISKGKHS